MNAVSDQRELTDPLPPRAADPNAPRVRTLLICDLADSTALVERLGDSPAAELIRRHDRVARDLLQRFRGREIDKTDGFLALFERPVEAVGFALHYQRALRQLGEDAKQELRARVGIHVGEVVLWENTRAEIDSGAKPLEVEGLAKPVVARLMALALPGQVLLSGVAFTLAQRAEKELVARAPLRWLTHGRYHFKGVPAPMLVHEVGEAGFAPLHAPPSGPKAQRDVPLWRRPGVLALEAIALLSAIAIPFALSLRAPSAIAFGERDWVVMGELRNLTGETLLDDSLATAFRISLEQSRHVNVLPDLKLRDALARMQRPADTAIDRAVASEIALREGARAVILPTVAEVGGRVRFSAELVDPSTQTTVYAESADGLGTDSALQSVDRVTQQLRARLGEEIAAIEQSSAPLPKVSSNSLEALRAYALGDRAYNERDFPGAGALFEEALRLDPEFALARIGQARVFYVGDRMDDARRSAERAALARDRLTQRDALYVDAWLASFGPPAAALEKWKMLLALYPDFHAAGYNLALFSWWLGNDFARCAETATQVAVPQYVDRRDALYLRANCRLGLGEFEAAAADLEQAVDLGLRANDALQVDLLAAQRRFDDAARALRDGADGATRSDGSATPFARLGLAVDRGDLEDAAAQLDALDASVIGPLELRSARLAQAALAATRGDAQASRRLAELIDAEAAALASDPPSTRQHAEMLLLSAGVLAARSGELALAERSYQLAAERARSGGYPAPQAMAEVLEAELALARDGAAAAQAQLPALAAERELFLTHVARLRVFAAAGEHAAAEREAEWLRAQHGRAYAEWGSRRATRVLNLLDANLVTLQAAGFAHAAGDRERAASWLQRFEAGWPAALWPEGVRREVERLRGAPPPS